jgi:hypothetical protein
MEEGRKEGHDRYMMKSDKKHLIKFIEEHGIRCRKGVADRSTKFLPGLCTMIETVSCFLASRQACDVAYT